MRRYARNDPSMQRFVAIIAAAVVLAGLGILFVVGSPPAENAGASSTPRAAASPPAVSLQKLAPAFDQPVYVTAPPGDASRLFVVEKTGAHQDREGRRPAPPAVPRHLRARSHAAASRACSRWPSTRATRATGASTSTSRTRTATRASSGTACPRPTRTGRRPPRPASSSASASPTTTTTAGSCSSARTVASTSAWATAAAAATRRATPRTRAAGWASCCAST